MKRKSRQIVEYVFNKSEVLSALVEYGRDRHTKETPGPATEDGGRVDGLVGDFVILRFVFDDDPAPGGGDDGEQ